jgi:dTDP-4-dehydrorhamnose 3,5-epimerase-like enzyme
VSEGSIRDLVRRVKPLARVDSEIVGSVTKLLLDEFAGLISVVEFRHGVPRGDHYHERRTETLYIVAGNLFAHFVDVDTRVGWYMNICAGEMITVSPRVAHRYVAHEDSLAVEIVREVFEPDDVVLVNWFD